MKRTITILLTAVVAIAIAAAPVQTVAADSSDFGSTWVLAAAGVTLVLLLVVAGSVARRRGPVGSHA